MANPNPSPATRFGPGNPGGGKTSEQRRMEYEAAEKSAKARLRLISVIAEKMDAPGATAEDVLAFLTPEALRLFRDSEDRAFGTPKTATEITGPNGGPLQTEDVTAADILKSRIDAIASRTTGGA